MGVWTLLSATLARGVLILIDEPEDVADDALDLVLAAVLGHVEVWELELDDVLGLVKIPERELDEVLRCVRSIEPLLKDGVGRVEMVELQYAEDAYLDRCNAARPSHPIEISA